jgi:hypothetical protein
MLPAIPRRPEATIGFKFKNVRAGAPKLHLQILQLKTKKEAMILLAALKLGKRIQ